MATSESKLRITGELDASLQSALKQIENALARIQAMANITVRGGGSTGMAAGGTSSAAAGINRSAGIAQPFSYNVEGTRRTIPAAPPSMVDPGYHSRIGLSRFTSPEELAATLGPGPHTPRQIMDARNKFEFGAAEAAIYEKEFSYLEARESANRSAWNMAAGRARSNVRGQLDSYASTMREVNSIRVTSRPTDPDDEAVQDAADRMMASGRSSSRKNSSASISAGVASRAGYPGLAEHDRIMSFVQSGGVLGQMGLTMRQAGAIGFAGMEGAQAIAQMQHLAIQQYMTGRPSIMGDAGMTGTLAGGALGAALGTILFPGVGTAFGAGIGGTLGNAVMQRFAAPAEMKAQAAYGMMPGGAIASGFYGGGPVGVVADNSMFGGWKETQLPGSVYHAARMSSWVQTRADEYARMGEKPPLRSNGFGVSADYLIDKDTWKAMMPGAPEIAQVYSGMERSLLRGGINPEAPNGTYLKPPTAPTMGKTAREYMDALAHGRTPEWLLRESGGSTLEAAIKISKVGAATAGGLRELGQDELDAVNKLIEKGNLGDRTTQLAKDLVDYTQKSRAYKRAMHTWQDNPNETVGQAMSRRLLDRFQRYGPEAQQMAGAVIEGLPQTGGNYADILAKYGPEALFAWRSAYYEKEQSPDVDLDKARGVYAGLQGADRQARLAGYGFRGVGRSLMGAYGEGMDAVKQMPGGDKSETYLALRKQRYAAEMQSYSEQDAIQYGIPMAQMEGMRDRAQVMPFAPGYSYGLALQGMSMRSNRIGLLGSRRESLRSRGMLSEADELRFVQEREALQTANASDVAMMSQGMLDRLPALSANLPRGMSRFDSYQLAAMNLMAYGSPRRDFGAVSGRQARMQDEFVTQYAGSPMTPYGGGDAMLNSGRGIALLQEIADLLRAATGVRGGGSSNMAPTGGNPPGANNAGFN